MNFYDYAQQEQYLFVHENYIKEHTPKELKKYRAIFKIWDDMTKEEREEVLNVDTKNFQNFIDLFIYRKISIDYIEDTRKMGTNMDRKLKDGSKEDGRLTCCFLLLTRFIELLSIKQVTEYLQRDVNVNYSLKDNPKATHLSLVDKEVSTDCDFAIFDKDIQSKLLVEQQQVVIQKYMNKDTYLKRLIFKTTKFFNYKDTTLDIRHLLTLLVEQPDGTYKEEYYMYKIKDIVNDLGTDRTWVTKKRVDAGEFNINNEYFKIYQMFGRHSLVFIENIDLEKHCTRII